MIEVRRTEEFVQWLSRLRDVAGAVRIAKRIDRLADGNFGDCKGVGNGVSELRFTFGPGYRVYFTRDGDVVVILLCGGDKSTQAADIEKAKMIEMEMRDGNRNENLGSG